MPEKPASEMVREFPSWILASPPAVPLTKPAAASGWHWPPTRQLPSQKSSNPCSNCCSTSVQTCACHSRLPTRKTCCPPVSHPNTSHDSKNSLITSPINCSRCQASYCQGALTPPPASTWLALSAAALKSMQSDCISSTHSTPVCLSHSTACQTCCSSWHAPPTITDQMMSCGSRVPDCHRHPQPNSDLLSHSQLHTGTRCRRSIQRQNHFHTATPLATVHLRSPALSNRFHKILQLQLMTHKRNCLRVSRATCRR